MIDFIRGLVIILGQFKKLILNWIYSQLTTANKRSFRILTFKVAAY